MSDATNVIVETFEQDCVPGRAEYALLRPAGAAQSALPLLLLLHGGESDCSFLARTEPLITACWEQGELPECVVATPSVGASFYMDYRDGSQRWETLVAERLPAQIAAAHGGVDLERMLLCGMSMGGGGGLRMAFKFPERFKAVAALEPGVEAAYAFAEIPLRDRFWRDDSSFEMIYGKPVDEAYWQANNLVNLARDQADRIRASGLAIFLEAGSDDAMLLQHGTEFLHRVLWDHGVKHEYRHVLGADHVGASLPDRFRNAFGFLGRALRARPESPEVAMFHAWVDQMKKRAGYED